MKLSMPEEGNWICVIDRTQTLGEPPVMTDLATYIDVMRQDYQLEDDIISQVMLGLWHVPALEMSQFGDELELEEAYEQILPEESVQ